MLSNVQWKKLWMSSIWHEEQEGMCTGYWYGTAFCDVEQCTVEKVMGVIYMAWRTVWYTEHPNNITYNTVPSTFQHTKQFPISTQLLHSPILTHTNMDLLPNVPLSTMLWKPATFQNKHIWNYHQTIPRPAVCFQVVPIIKLQTEPCNCC